VTAKTTVTITEAQTELGELLAYHWVTVRLVHGGQGGVVDGQVIGSAGSAKFQLDDEGSGSFAVYPNAAITPAGTYYAVSVDGTSPLVARLLNVPTSGPVDWADEAIQVDEPSPPTTVPAPTSGDAFDVLRVDSAGTRYELAPAEVSGENVDVDGTPLPTVLTASFSAVYSAVSAEASARAAAVTAEATARGNADTAESNARIAGDAASTKAATGLQDVLRAEATERLSVLPRFQLCGDSGAPHSGSAYTAPALPDFTTGAYWRFNVTARPDFDTDLTGLFYSEIITQTHDAGVGSWDNYEIAVQWIYDTDTESWRPTLFMEWTEIDGLAETHSLATESASSAAGVTYPAWEFQPGVPTEIAVHLDFANGDGNWDLSFWRRIHFGTADATFDDAEWVRISRAIGTGATSIDTGVTAPHGFGMGDGNLELFSLTIRDEGPAGTVLADPTAADAYAEGDGQPFDDPAGNTWTPGATAHVAVPSTGGGSVTLTGDVTGSGTGSFATTIGASKVTSSMIVDGTIVDGDLAAAVSRRIPTTVVLTSDQTRTTTSQADTTGFAVPYVNGDAVAVRFHMFTTGDSSGDLTFSAQFTNATVMLSVAGLSSAASGVPANHQVQGIISTTGDTVNIGTFTGSTQAAVIEGTIRATGTGTLQLQHAIRSAVGTSAVKAGSSMTYSAV
jgi:hypothetical protein